MVVMNINDIKNSIMNSIRTYLYPMQTICTGSINLANEEFINQPFIPFNTSINQVELYVANVTGTPDRLRVSILNDDETLYSTLTSINVGWNTVSTPVSNLSSGLQYTLQLSEGANVDNNYYIGCTENKSYFYGTLSSGSILTFNIPVNDKVYKIFPGQNMSVINSLPLVVVDISSRPLATDAYIHGDVIREILNVKVECYARTPRETDLLCYGVERGINLNRKSFMRDAFKITPADLGPLNFISQEIFYREVNFHLDLFVSRE